MGGRRDGLLSIEKQWWDGARGSTKSARVSESDSATSQAVWLPLFSGCTDGCTHLSVGGGLHRFSGIEKRCWDCAGGRAQSARVLESATARRRRLGAGLGCFQSHRGVHILARTVDVTDFATEKWCWDCAGGRAQSARVSESDCATGQAVFRPCASSNLNTDACAHLGGRWT